MAITTSEATSIGDRLVETVSAWPGVSVGPHRFGAMEFTIGDREIGHVHGGRVLDVNFPRVKDVLIAEGSTGEHRFAGGGWTTFHAESDDDVDRAIRLLRISYLYAALTLRRKPAGREILEHVDLDDELERLDSSEELRSIFERMRL